MNPSPVPYVLDHDLDRRALVVRALGTGVRAVGSVTELLEAAAAGQIGPVVVAADSALVSAAREALRPRVPLLVWLPEDTQDDPAQWLAHGADDVLLAPLAPPYR